MATGPERDAEVRRLFAAAMDRPPPDRIDWLRGACSDDGLVREVAELVAVAAEGGHTIDRILAELPRIGEGVGPPDPDLTGLELTHYRILERLGAGGMGVVYKAIDTRLQRTVALKLLPPSLAEDADARARFLHEARVASALDHPGICTIHEIEDGDPARPFIVMAFVEGETLQERIGRGPMPIAEVIDVATQVAHGLHHAHQRGVVHRDIKPANVMVTGDGEVRILDFGLAKVPDVSLTRSGTTLGTVRCMSPEQVRDEPVDARTDIWALGVLIYEMVTGRPAFQGSRTEAILHAILSTDPAPMTSLRVGVPVELDRIVSKALARDPAARVEELPVDLAAIDATRIRSAAAPAHAARPRPGSLDRRSTALGVVVGGTLALAIAGLVSSVRARPDAAPAQVSFEIPLPAGYALSSWYRPIAISPDGSRVVYAARGDGPGALYLRRLDRLEAVQVPGTEGGREPFFSPDGRWIAYVAGGELRRVEVDGGISQTIAEVPPTAEAGSWGPGGDIVFPLSPSSGLMTVPWTGGVPEPLTEPDAAAGEVGHGWPQHLPNGDLLFTVWSGDGFRAAVRDAASGEWHVVVDGVAAAAYVDGGHLLFARMSSGLARPELLAADFDLERAETRGAPTSVLEEPGLAGPNFAVSRGGTLVYVSGGSPAWAGLDRTALVWRDSTGADLAEVSEGVFEAPRLSPDGSHFAVGSYSLAGAFDTWVHSLDRGPAVRISLVGSINNYPVWRPDGASVTFNSARSPLGLYSKRADGTGEAELLAERRRQGPQIPGSWSPDGRTLIYAEFDAHDRGDLWVYETGRGTSPLVATPASELAPSFSPDGTHIAYVSTSSGRAEVYVRPYPGPGSTLAISTDGGEEPVWAPDGRTLYYLEGPAMMAVAVSTSPELRVGRPRRLFSGRRPPALRFRVPNYDVAADGRFLTVEAVAASTPTRLTVVVGWAERLGELVGR